eukprot:8269953-Heterocapsa_arctica.AAC.1
MGVASPIHINIALHRSVLYKLHTIDQVHIGIFPLRAGPFIPRVFKETPGVQQRTRACPGCCC